MSMNGRENIGGKRGTAGKLEASLESASKGSTNEEFLGELLNNAKEDPLVGALKPAIDEVAELSDEAEKQREIDRKKRELHNLLK